jgi:hypothetical protein
LLRQLGASWEPHSAPGAPDGFLGFGGQTHPCEVKRPGQKLRPLQQAWIRGWNGSPVQVLRTAEDVYRLLHIKT